MTYSGGVGGDDGRIGIAFDMVTRDRPKRREGDVARKPEPPDRPDPRAQWDEVRGKWVVWDDHDQRWVVVDDEDDAAE